MKIFVSSDNYVDEALNMINYSGYLKMDTETSGLDPFTCKLRSVQIGDKDTDILFPWNAMSEESRDKVRAYVSGKTIVAHNAKFDSKFLIVNGFDIKDCWCTQEIDKILYAGKYYTFKLADLMIRRFQIRMDKEAREIFYSKDPDKRPLFDDMVDELGEWGAWTDELIEYALADIEPLLEIREQQEKEAKLSNCSNVVWLENKLVLKTAYMELRGVCLDEDRVRSFADRMTLIENELRIDINKQLEDGFALAWQKEYDRRMRIYDKWKVKHQEIVKSTGSMRREDDKRKKTEEALKMVADSLAKKPYPSIPVQTVPFNIRSHDHMRMTLSEITGLNITTTNKEWLDENRDLHPAIEKISEHRKYEKLKQFTEILGDINKVTGRIHASFWQNGTKTGRYSCSDPNLQQIPARSDEGKEFRTMFVAPKGYKMVGADFEGIELVILAVLSGEQMLIDAINEGKDVHCFTMSKFLRCSYDAVYKTKEGIDLTGEETEDIEQARVRFDNRFRMPELHKIETLRPWVKKLRDFTKTMTYGVVYGLSPFGLSAKFHCDFEEAEAFIKLVFGEVYASIKNYLRASGDKGLSQGFNATELGRRRYFTKPRYPSYEEMEATVIKKLKKEKRVWESVEEDEWAMLMQEAIDIADKEYKGKINAIRRMSANSAIQGLSADITKLSMHLFEDKFNGGLEEGLILTVHDELWALVREERAEEAKEILEYSMKRAGNKFLPSVRIGADAKITDYWEK